MEIFYSFLASLIISLILFGLLCLPYFLTKNKNFKKYVSPYYFTGILIVILTVTIYPKILAYTQHGWNLQEEKKLKQLFKAGVSDRGFPLSDKQKEEFADCLLSKVKLKYPNWTQNDKNSVKDDIPSFSDKCLAPILGFQKMKGWTPYFEKFLKDNLFKSSDMIKSFPDEKIRDELCQCMVEKLKAFYPDGYEPADVKFNAIRIYGDCFKKLK